jgi:hypothetical protein
MHLLVLCVSVDDHAEGNEKLPSMFAEARRAVVLRSCILACWWLGSEEVGGKNRVQVWVGFYSGLRGGKSGAASTAIVA